MPELRFDKLEDRFDVSITFDKENHIEIPYKKLILTDLNTKNEIIVIDTNEDPFQVIIEETTALENHHIKTLIEDNLDYLAAPYILLLIRNSNEQLSAHDEPIGMTHRVNTLILAAGYTLSPVPLEAFYFYRIRSGDIILENTYWHTISL